MGPIPISPVPCSPTYRGSTVLVFGEIGRYAKFGFTIYNKTKKGSASIQPGPDHCNSIYE